MRQGLPGIKNVCLSIKSLELETLSGWCKVFIPAYSRWVKNPPTMQESQETPVPSLGWEDPLEEGMASHCRILAWRIPWMETSGGL